MRWLSSFQDSHVYKGVLSLHEGGISQLGCKLEFLEIVL
jgi:hypothetical protein